MTSLFYKIVGEFGEFRKGTGTSAKNVRFHIDGKEGGILTVGKISAPLRGGVATLSLSALDDGTYVPKLYCRGELISLEAIEKCGCSVSICRSDPALARELALRTEALEARVGELERLCEGFREAIEGRPLFEE